MTARIGSRFALSRIASVVMAETRLAGQGVPDVLRHLAPIVAWSAASIALGVVVGLAAVILPPIGSFAIVAAAAVVLLWAMPDLPLVSPRLIRKAFFIMLIADISIPFYYTVQLPGLPWISVRRLATFALIAPFLIAISASSGVRAHMAKRIRSLPLIFICAAGYLVVAVLSNATSLNPTMSISALTEAVLSWYVPFFAIIYIAQEDDAVLILKVICVCALFNTAAGLVEFTLQHPFFIYIFPASTLATLIQDNPSLGLLLPSAHSFRNGLYRASSTFATPLSFGEFEIITIPLGLFFALHRDNLFDKTLGCAVILGGFLGIYISGSRGGWVGALSSLAVFVTIWSIRQGLKSKASLAPAIAGLVGVVGFSALMSLIIGSHTVHDMVLGGSAQANSTEARYDQFWAGIPFVISNPITGHGFSLGGYAIESSIDTYVVSLLIETGIPGLVFFAGLLLIPVWYGIRNYLSNKSEASAAAGAIACSVVAFICYRLALSQRENHTLIFSLLAITVVLNEGYARKRAPDLLSEKLVDKPAAVGRAFAAPNRQELQAARSASLIMAVLILYLVATCLHMFTHWL